MRYAGTDDFLSSGGGDVPDVPPVPGIAPGANWLENDPYQRTLTADMPPSAPGASSSRRATTDEDDEEDDGTTRFGQFASKEFAKNGMSGRRPGGPPSRSMTSTSIGGEGIMRAPEVKDEWDLTELGKENFDLQGFLRRTLAGADHEEVQRFHAALRDAKESNAKELQHNVFKQ